jgi:hypothetical protein
MKIERNPVHGPAGSQRLGGPGAPLCIQTARKRLDQRGVPTRVNYLNIGRRHRPPATLDPSPGATRRLNPAYVVDGSHKPWMLGCRVMTGLLKLRTRPEAESRMRCSTAATSRASLFFRSTCLLVPSAAWTTAVGGRTTWWCEAVQAIQTKSDAALAILTILGDRQRVLIAVLPRANVYLRVAARKVDDTRLNVVAAAQGGELAEEEWAALAATRDAHVRPSVLCRCVPSTTAAAATNRTPRLEPPERQKRSTTRCSCHTPLTDMAATDTKR